MTKFVQETLHFKVYTEVDWQNEDFCVLCEFHSPWLIFTTDFKTLRQSYIRSTFTLNSAYNNCPGTGVF